MEGVYTGGSDQCSGTEYQQPQRKLKLPRIINRWGYRDTILTVSVSKQCYREALFGKTDLSERLLSMKPEGWGPSAFPPSE